MLNIKNFLKKFTDLDKSNSLKLLTIANTIKEKSGVDVDEKSIEIKKDRAIIKRGPTEKNEIMMHKAEIESELRKNNIFLKLV